MYSVNHETDRQLLSNIKPAVANRPPDREKHRKNSNDAILKNKELLAIVQPHTKSEETNEEDQQWIYQQQQFDPDGNSKSVLKSKNNVQKVLPNKGKGNSPSKVNASKNPSKNHNQTLPQRKLPPAVLATTNSVFLDFTQNWLESIRRLKVRPKNITIVTEDNATYEALAEYPEVYRVKPSFMLPPNKTLVFDTPEYKAFVNKRPKYILDLLEKNIDVLFSDVDTVWMEDPFPYFAGDFDMFIQEDQPQPKLVLCAGFSYYRSNANMIQFMKDWIRRLEINKNKKPDQMVLNIMLREKRKLGKSANFKYKVLDQKKFLSGREYFDDDWRRNNTDVKPVFLHNNWVIGHDIKVERFKNLGYWYI